MLKAGYGRVGGSALFLGLLAGCGGGSGGSSSLSALLPKFAAPAPIDIAALSQGFAIGPSVASNLSALLSSARYRNTVAGLTWIRSNIDPTVPSGATQNPLRTSGAAFAHAAGLTGQGQVIAFSDGHVSTSHEAIAGRVSLYSNGPSTIDGQADEHGTSVLSVAIGDSSRFVGTAPGASAIYGQFWDEYDLAAVGQAAKSQGAVAWNNSWGYTTYRLNQTDFNTAFSGYAGNAYLSAIRDYSSQGVVVFSLSNYDTGHAGLMDGLPVLDHSLEAGWLAVGNGVPTLSNGQVSRVHLLSSACYEAARWCLVADGTWKAAVGSGSAYKETTGSSFAAPQVSGALALLAEAFPTLTPHQLRVRLLASAEDDFFKADGQVELADGFTKGYSVTYGHGFLDIEAALRPIGATSMSLASGAVVATDAPVISAGTGFGDALETALEGTKVAVQDSLAGGFAMDATALTTSVLPVSSGDRVLARAMMADIAPASGPAADPFAEFIGPVLTVDALDDAGMASLLLPQSGTGPAGVALSRQIGDGAAKLDLGVKLARDGAGLLSLGGRQSANMAALTFGVTAGLGGGSFLSLSGEAGMTDLGGATALTTGSAAAFNAVKIAAGTSNVFSDGDRLTLGLGVPVAISSGSVRTELPVHGDRGTLAYQPLTLDLAPKSRQVDLELAYEAGLTDQLGLRMSVVHSQNHGNRAGLASTGGALVLSFQF